jgi:hypothetical protein
VEADMRQVYLESIRPPYTAKGQDREETVQARVREALERVVERATDELGSPVEPLSVAFLSNLNIPPSATATMQDVLPERPALVVLVETVDVGFRPLGV